MASPIQFSDVSGSQALLLLDTNGLTFSGMTPKK
jgi:hypothetical protein